ncbi:hypothetical protein BFW01_g2705 [Lasiodiplodia theobromae]|nr:hypothetical protein BFW01_g2705 [Lasiodiplodia theobromae]
MIQTQSYLDSIDLKSNEGNLSIEFNADSTIHLEYRNGPLVYPNNGSDFRKFQLHDFETSLYMEDDAQDLKLLTTTNTWFTSSRPQTKYWFDIEPTKTQQNDENLIRLLQKLLTDDEVKLRIKGAPKVKLDGMPREYKVKWDKMITMNGFGGISTFNSWRDDAFLYSDLLADWENDQDSPFHYYTIGDLTNAENTRGRLTIDISRIAVDVYADGNIHFGTGNITVLGGLPEQSSWQGADVEIRLLDNTTRDDIEDAMRGMEDIQMKVRMD